MEKYSIITNPNYTSSVNVGIRIIPDNEILRFFLALIDVIKIPNLLINTSKSKRFGVENAHILFYDEMDWEEKDGLDIKEGDVNIYVYDGKSNEIVLNESLFDRILYDYSNKVLEIYKNNEYLPENWSMKMEQSLKQLKIKILSKDLELSQKNVFYTFYDGVKLFNNISSYNDWLSSTDYSVWSNSYVEVGNKRINIIKENVKTLSTFSHFNKEKLELLAKQHELEIKEENGVYYAYTPNHNSRQLEISENKDLIVIYSIDGGRAPESIFIYGVFEK
jgi:ferredoxin-fold anticodon binding domain-containing protein